MQAPEYDVRPVAACAYYSYFSGVPQEDIELYVRENCAFGGAPTNGGLHLVMLNWPAGDFPEVRADVEGQGSGLPGRHAIPRHLVDRILVYRAPIIIGEGKSSVGYVGLTDLAAALDWLETERENLVRVVVLADSHDLIAPCWQLADALFRGGLELGDAGSGLEGRRVQRYELGRSGQATARSAASPAAGVVGDGPGRSAVVFRDHDRRTHLTVLGLR